MWLALLAVAVAELAGHFVVRARVAPTDDWVRAAELVRSEWREGDLVVAAPEWTDPVLRMVLGDRIPLASAGRPDLAGFRRLWALSTRGHRPAEAPAGAPELEREIGAVRVLRWRLDEERALYDFVAHIADARVSRVENGAELPCRWQSFGRATGGALGAGPITPAERWVCDPRRPWLWVGATVNEDLDLRPRRCVWQHPQGAEPIRASFEDVPLGERLVLYADLYYEHERDRTHAPFDVVVRIDGEEVGRMLHVDGDGWKRIEAAPPEGRERGTVAIEVSAEQPDLRSVCWAASTRAGGPE